MNRNEFEDRERRWNQGSRQQEGNWSFGGQPGYERQEYGSPGQRQPDRFTRQGTDRTYSMQTDYEEPQRGYNQGYRGQASYGPEGAWTGGAGYGAQSGWEQQRTGGQNFGQQRGYGYEGQRGGYDFDDRSRFQGSGWQQSSSGQQGGYSQRGMNRGGASSESGTPSGYGMEGWGQQAYRGSDYGNDFSYGGGGQQWREGNRRAQGYPGTDYYSGRGQENPWGERSMRGGNASLWGGAWSGQQQGPHTGKGPRGYQRGDDRIREDVCEMLSNHGDIDASEIDIEVRGGEVTLKGTVEDRWQKRMAEDLVENCSGVKDVRNELRVTHRGGVTSGAETMGSFATQSAGTSGSTTGTTATTSGTTGRTNETTTARSR